MANILSWFSNIGCQCHLNPSLMSLISGKLSRSLYFNLSEDSTSDSISGANANQYCANANLYGANANQYGANSNQYGANANKTSAYAITTMSTMYSCYQNIKWNKYFKRQFRSYKFKNTEVHMTKNASHFRGFSLNQSTGQKSVKISKRKNNVQINPKVIVTNSNLNLL